MNELKSKPNIILVVLDALRARNLGCYGYDKKTSVNIDNLTRRGVLFENAFSSSNVSDRSLVSMFGGRHVLVEGQNSPLLNKSEIDSFFDSGGCFIQEILKKEGYSTYALDILLNWRNRGFDYFYYEGDYKKAYTIKHFVDVIKKNQLVGKMAQLLFYYIMPRFITDKFRMNKITTKITNDTIGIIKKNKKPFFIYVKYSDTHNPYGMYKEYSNKFKTKEKSERFYKILAQKRYNKVVIDFYKSVIDRRDSIGDVIARYNGAIAFDDFEIGKIIKVLEEENLLDDTLICITSDHGESLDEHNIYFDHHGLYDASVKIPMIMVGLKLPNNRRIKGLVQLTDIVPTLLDLVGIKYDAETFDGRSLLPLINGQKEKIRDFAFMQESYLQKKSAIRNFKFKYIEAISKEDAFCNRCKNVHGGVIELYDLEKDSGETKNIASERKDVVIKLSMELNKVINEIKDNNEKRKIKRVVSRL